MNKIYNLVWNRSREQIEVASELTRSRGGGAMGTASGTGMRLAQLALAITLAAGMAPMSLAGTNCSASSGTATGTNSTVCGNKAKGSGASSTAFGYAAQATGDNSTALGLNAQASGLSATALGTGSVADDLATAVGVSAKAGLHGTALGMNSNAASDATAVGENANASGTAATALGNGTVASGASATAVGNGANAASAGTAVGNGAVAATNGTAVGLQAHASADAAAVGQQSDAQGINSAAFGFRAKAYSNHTLAIGDGAQAGDAASTLSDMDAIALGTDAIAAKTDSVALGHGAQASFTGSVALGAASVTAAAQPTASTTINGVTYDFAGATPTSVVSVGEVGSERQITNVAAGRLSANSTDAVNGSQLYATNQELDQVVQMATLGWDLTTTAVGSGVVNGSSLANVASGATATLTAGNNVVITQSGTSVTFGVNPGLTGMNSISFTGGGPTLDGSGIDMGNTKATNVADGTISATSKDAVNGSQLYSTNQAVTNLQQGHSGVFQTSTDVTGTPSATGTNSAAGGSNASATGDNSLAVGNDSAAAGDGSTAIGTSANAGGTGSTALGDGAHATGSNSVALGAGSLAAGDDTVSVGSSGHERKITNVAAGTAPTDAVNVDQLQQVSKGSVRYDTNADGSPDYNSVTLNPGGSGPTVVHNVATGVADTDAVNVDQLNQGIAGAVTTANNYTDQRFSELKGDLSQIGNRANAGIASAIAAASLPQPYAPNQSSLGVGVGTFHGEAGIAVGLSKITESGRWILKANVNSDTRGAFGAGIGAGIVW